MTDKLPARLLPAWVLVGWWLAWIVAPGLVLWYRYRKLTP
jgi:hypothetical protein